MCNHPDLFEGRAIVSAFDMPPLAQQLPTVCLFGVLRPALECVDLASHGLLLTQREPVPSWAQAETWRLQVRVVGFAGSVGWEC